MDKVSGEIKNITFHNSENGYSVFNLIRDGDDSFFGGTLTVVGIFSEIYPGLMLEIEGEWINHSKYGRQFSAAQYKRVTPSGKKGMEKYLASGLIKGIGPRTAALIVEKFGEKTAKVLDNYPEKLLCIKGISPGKLKMITEAWNSHKDIQGIAEFLQKYDLPTGTSVKIFKEYGKDSLKMIEENPYRLSSEIRGIGFKKADEVALKMGIKKDDYRRLAAGIVFLIAKASADGHTFLYREELYSRAFDILEAGPEKLVYSLDELKKERKVLEDNERFYSFGLYFDESAAAAKIKKVFKRPRKNPDIDIDKVIDDYQIKNKMELSSEQKDAVKAAGKEKVLLITGGPGTGKTTVQKCILSLLKKSGRSFKLAAPTGRAAKRMSELSGVPASTIHRMLIYNPANGGFEKNSNNMLKADTIIIDEFSMVDISLFASLMDAVNPETSLIFTGDIDQLPSVGPGMVFSDLMTSGLFRTVRLETVFRQAAKSRIVTNAHLINRGKKPVLENSENSDFFFMSKNTEEEAAETVVDLVNRRLPGKYGYDPMKDIQVLTPMHAGASGTVSLNERLRKSLNDQKSLLKRGGKVFGAGDRIMQTKNNYDKLVFNGDIGYVEEIDVSKGTLRAVIAGRSAEYSKEELDEISPAYCVTIHKSQGSEFPCVVIPLCTRHYIMLKRNLIYTAVTRGKSTVVIVGSKKALSMAVRNNDIQKRNSALGIRIREDG
ncbi:MAG: ATP-dependent RecD-like DNA helicase [Fibrobacterota bacterium]